jgi:hypothetical protein
VEKGDKNLMPETPDSARKASLVRTDMARCNRRLLPLASIENACKATLLPFALLF